VQYFDAKFLALHAIIHLFFRTFLTNISYGIGDVFPWIIGTMKGRGTVKTGIKNLYIEATYMPNESGKYVFDSGKEIF
jgi:hypothetical protein